MSVQAAGVRARDEFGDVDSVRESLRTIDARIVTRQRRAQWWEQAAKDLRHVFRSLRRAQMFTLTVIATLALGLGANATVYSLLHQLYSRVPLGVSSPASAGKLYEARARAPGDAGLNAGFDFTEIREIRYAAPDDVRPAAYRSSRVQLARQAGENEITGESAHRCSALLSDWVS